MRTIALLPVVLVAGAVLAGCGGGSTTAPATVTVQAPPTAAAPAAGASPSAAPVTDVTLPAVEGRNGSIVFSELSSLGLTNFEMASQDTEDKLVLNPANWTAVKIEPGAGETVKSNQKVVVTMTKTG